MYLLSFTMGRYLSLSVSLCKVPNDFVTENTRSGRDINQKCETLNYLVETIRLLQKDIHLETGFVWHFHWYVSVPLLFYLMCSFLVHSQHEGKIINGPANKKHKLPLNKQGSGVGPSFNYSWANIFSEFSSFGGIMMTSNESWMMTKYRTPRRLYSWLGFAKCVFKLKVRDRVCVCVCGWVHPWMSVSVQRLFTGL